VADADAERFIKIFTSMDKETIDALIEEHRQDPGRRILQKRLAEEVTILVHGREDYEAAVEASNILFGKSTKESLLRLDEKTLLDVFAGVRKFEVSRELFQGEGVKAVDLLVENAQCFASKGEMRKLTQGGGVSINKEKLAAFDKMLTEADLLDGKYLLAQSGKKNYFLLIVK
jgi:tyrosyl-tRNA synthetase